MRCLPQSLNESVTPFGGVPPCARTDIVNDMLQRPSRNTLKSSCRRGLLPPCSNIAITKAAHHSSHGP
eukprot:8529147-Pyramimonas_sp.AAC.1